MSLRFGANCSEVIFLRFLCTSSLPKIALALGDRMTPVYFLFTHTSFKNTTSVLSFFKLKPSYVFKVFGSLFYLG